MAFPERRDSNVGNGFHRTENSHSAVLEDANLINTRSLLQVHMLSCHYPIYLQKKSFQTEHENLASYHYRQMSAVSFE
jgi:hypothetical protein